MHPNLKTHDEDVSIFQLKQLFTFNSPPPPHPLPRNNVGSGKVDLQHMSPKYLHCIRGEGDKVWKFMKYTNLIAKTLRDGKYIFWTYKIFYSIMLLSKSSGTNVSRIDPRCFYTFEFNISFNLESCRFNTLAVKFKMQFYLVFARGK
jgi:hypothetical protein